VSTANTQTGTSVAGGTASSASATTATIDSIASNLRCPLTKKIMRDPVFLEGVGITYEVTPRNDAQIIFRWCQNVPQSMHPNGRLAELQGMPYPVVLPKLQGLHLFAIKIYCYMAK